MAEHSYTETVPCGREPRPLVEHTDGGPPPSHEDVEVTTYGDLPARLYVCALCGRERREEPDCGSDETR